MNPSKQNESQAGLMAKMGAFLFLLWAILHIWVGAEGLHQYFTNGTKGLWDLIIGGEKVPHQKFIHSTDSTTLFAHSHLLLNFVIDVAGYGVLGLFVAWIIWKKASWIGYFIGLIAIGIADLAFLFVTVLSGVAELNLPSLSGPIIWFLAIIITPFGLPKFISTGLYK